MRHGNVKHKLGVKTQHRASLLSNLAVALITHGRINTTQAKAKALRPFIEKVITLAVKASKAQEPKDKLHFRRLALARVRDTKAVAKLFDERVQEFADRPGGYTRIYKLIPRRGDAAAMALIELIDGSDEGYKKSRSKSKSAAKPKPRAKKEETKPAAEETQEAVVEEKSE